MGCCAGYEAHARTPLALLPLPLRVTYSCGGRAAVSSGAAVHLLALFGIGIWAVDRLSDKRLEDESTVFHIRPLQAPTP